MSTKYHCGGCDNGCIIVDSGGVSRCMVCPECGVEMQTVPMDDDEEPVWVGHQSEHTDYATKRKAESVGWTYR